MTQGPKTGPKPAPTWAQNEASGKTILFFDGVCGLCNRFVDWTLTHDKSETIVFTALQGKTAVTHVTEQDRLGLESVVVLKDGKLLRKTDAVAAILSTLGGLWSFAGSTLQIIPRPFRDFFYDRVANSRYKLFGKKDVCRIPTVQERRRFLP